MGGPSFVPSPQKAKVNLAEINDELNKLAWDPPLRELTVVRYQSRKRKPGPTARHRAKRRRAEAPVAAKVRAACVERDGYCRFLGLTHCAGLSQWAHLGEKKRARTRGMAPEERHTTSHSLQACERHHGLYDAGKLTVGMTERGADGPMRAQFGSLVLVC